MVTRKIEGEQLLEIDRRKEAGTETNDTTERIHSLRIRVRHLQLALNGMH